MANFIANWQVNWLNIRSITFIVGTNDNEGGSLKIIHLVAGSRVKTKWTAEVVGVHPSFSEKEMPGKKVILTFQKQRITHALNGVR